MIDDTDAFGLACGIWAEDGWVENSGAVTVAATGGSTISLAPETEHEVSSMAWACGLRLHDFLGYRYPNRYADNSGDLTVTATGGTSTGSVDEANAYAYAYGISSDRALVANSGRIMTTATGGNAESTFAGSDHGAYASSWAHGISAAHEDVDNRGDVIAVARGGTATAQDAAIASANAEACGLDVWTDGSRPGLITVKNTGAITARATGGTASSASTWSSASAAAWGLRTWYADVDNEGDISVVAEGGSVGPGALADASAYGIEAGYGDIVNGGAITVTSTASPGSVAKAFGIYVGVHAEADSSLTNTGVIRASAADIAYEVYVESTKTLTLVDTYNVTLDGDPSQGSLYVGGAATLALNNATLTASAVDGETLWDTEYRLFETGDTGTVDGQFGAVRAVNPNTAVTYYDQGTSDSADDTVALAYAPIVSASSASVAAERQAVSQAVDIVNTHMTTSLLRDLLTPLSSPLLADAGATVATGLPQSSSGSRDGVFVEPYYSQIDKDADPLGYDATLWGFSGGYERYIENSLVGLHFGYGRSEIDFTGPGQAGNGEDQDVLVGGFSGLTRWDEWSLRYGVAGFYGWHDFAGLTGLALDEREEASYDSYGVTANAMLGYPIRRGDHALLPEVGASYVWAHRQRYTTDATDPSWNATYSAMNEHDVLAEASLRWLSRFRHGDVQVTPSVAVGVRHLLTDSESSVWQSVPGAAPVLVSSKRDRTALTLAGSVALAQGSHSLSVAYDGEYSSDVRRHNLWLRFGWEF
jgi:hypothetical protein